MPSNTIMYSSDVTRRLTKGYGSTTQPIYVKSDGTIDTCTAYSGANVASAGKWTTARTLTIGVTGKNVDGSTNVSWSMNEIMGSSDSSKFYRGDKTWSNTLTSSLIVNGHIEGDAGIIGNRDQWGLDMFARPFTHHATNPSSTNGGNLYYSAGNKDYYNNPRWCFAQYSYTASSTVTNGHMETYRLPATEAGLTENATYEIRTSKSSAYNVDTATSASTCTGNSYGLLSSNTSQAAESCYDGAPGLHFWRYNGSSGQSGGDGWIAQWSWNSGSVGGQIYLDDNPSYTMMIRGRNNDENHTFNAWKRIQLCDGTGASGTWGISVTGNAGTATRINGNLAAATSNVDRNIWVSSTANADGIPNYISHFNMNPSTNVFTVPAGTRISPNAGALYLGNSGNQSWVYVQDMCSQQGNDKWKITQAGSATFLSCHGAVWNDLAEYRKCDLREAGYAIAPSGSHTFKRLEAGVRIISDTYGFALGGSGEGEHNLMPVAIAGRVLAYPYKDKSEYKIGDAVCSAPGGTVDIMTRDEIKEYPDRIIGIVNEIPDYDIWEPSREGGGANPFIQMGGSGQMLDNFKGGGIICQLIA